MNPEAAFEYLRHGLDTGRLAQSYVVEGHTRGKALDLVTRVAQMVFCMHAGGERPCSECSACRHVAGRTHPDLHWIEPQKKSRKISIDQVRELQKQVYQTTHSSAWKVCVIVGADRMGAEAANAFLKTLEEPPARSLFLLLTDSPQSLLPTVISRCQRICVREEGVVLRSDWYDELLAILTGDDESVPPIIRSFGRSERLNRLLKKMKDTAREEELASASGGDLDEDDETIEARAGARYREWRSQVLLAMLQWYRDILALTCDADEMVVHYGGNLDTIRNKAGKVTYRQAMNNVTAIEAMCRQMDQNIPDNAVLNLAFCRLTC